MIGIEGFNTFLKSSGSQSGHQIWVYYQSGHYKKVVLLTYCPGFYCTLLKDIIYSPNLFLAVNMSSGAAKFLSSLPSPSLFVDSGSAGCSALGLCEYNT